jgi:glycosyltransferase involved in cell wall biosynthesis
MVYPPSFDGNPAIDINTVNCYASVKTPDVYLLGRNRSQVAAAQKTIGILAPTYGMERVSYLNHPDGFRFFTLKRWPFHRLNANSSFLDNTALLLNPSVDLVHTFNTLPLNGKRFIVSFEIELPRYLENQRPWQHRLGWRLLASSRCKHILALSEAAKHLLQQQYADRPEIAQKINVFRGAVLPSPIPVTDRAYSQSGPLRLLFVGAEAYRKGFLSVLTAVKQLHAQGVELQLTVVSSFDPDSYISVNGAPPPPTIQAEIQSLPWITYHPQLSNVQVRQLMRHHDLLLIPSFDESLGWVIAEAGMEGLGVIATHMFAFPELVDDGQTGRLLPFPVNDQHRWHGLSLPIGDRHNCWRADSQHLAQHLVDTLHQIALNRDLPQQWGQAAYTKAMQLYHPQQAAQTLKHFYTSALT